MAKVYGMWWGGHDYARGEIDTDLEVFDSIAAAKTELMNRRQSNGVFRCSFDYADGRHEFNYCPTVGQESTMDIWLYDPREINNGPDRRLVFGIRGAVKVERN